MWVLWFGDLGVEKSLVVRCRAWGLLFGRGGGLKFEGVNSRKKCVGIDKWGLSFVISMRK